MIIRTVTLWELSGHGDGAWRDSARVVRPLDIYPEFAQAGPEQRQQPDPARLPLSKIYLEITTDDDLTGCYGPISSEQAYLIATVLAPFLRGRDPLSIQLLWDQMHRLDRHGRRGYLMLAISAVDCALWDVRGKYFGVPIYRLLGGPTRAHVQAYASTLGYSVAPEQARERAQALAAEGFTAQKWFFRHGPAAGAAGRQQNVALVRALRDTLGDDTALMFDCFMGWDVNYATALAAEIVPYTPAWLEEPLPPTELDGYRRLKRAVGLPLAAGEHLYTRWDVKPFLDAGVLDVLQCDPDWCGGISELVKICALAETYGVTVVPHGHSLAPALHVVAAQSPALCPMIEYLCVFMEQQQFFHAAPLRPVKGVVALPTAPGLGIALDESKIEQRRELTWNV